jgi:hypothetical protein
MKISVLTVLPSITVILSLSLPVKTPKQSRSVFADVLFPVHFFLIRESFQQPMLEWQFKETPRHMQCRIGLPFKHGVLGLLSEEGKGNKISENKEWDSCAVFASGSRTRVTGLGIENSNFFWETELSNRPRSYGSAHVSRRAVNF